MKNILRIGFSLIFLIPLILNSCSKSDDGIKNFDPSKPVELHTFLPDSGGIRTKFIIEGDNFGSDKEKVQVFFGDREALVLDVKPTTIYCMVPKQVGGLSTVKVLVEENEVEFAEKQFNYIVASSISTVIGKAKDPGDKNGTIGEATLNLPRYIAVDLENNLFIVEGDNSRIRLVALDNNKTLTLFDKTLLGQLTFTDENKKQLLGLGDGDQAVYMFDSETGWIPEVLGKIATNGSWIHSVAVGPDKTHILTRINTGDFICAPFNGKKGMTPEKSVKLGEMKIQGGGQNGHIIYNPVDGYIYGATNKDNAIWRMRVTSDYTPATTTIEPFIANGLGFEDGPISSAKFNTPKGIAVDSEGNLYIADEGNNRIRKIDLQNNIVTTVAGSGIAGYKDGAPLEAELKGPTGVYVDHNDFIYIADRQNHCVRKLAIE